MGLSGGNLFICAYDSTTGSCNPFSPFSFHRKLKISQAEKYPDSRKKSFTRQNSPAKGAFHYAQPNGTTFSD